MIAKSGVLNPYIRIKQMSPLYQRQCETCSYSNEELEKISAEDIIICPKCGKKTYKKAVTKTAFTLAGKGWYKDGYSN